jgi:hypothetical protein
MPRRLVKLTSGCVLKGFQGKLDDEGSDLINGLIH